MIKIKYRDDTEIVKPVYITIDKNILKYAMVEEGICVRELESYEVYFVVVRKTPQENLHTSSAFENEFFKNGRIVIISKTELNSLYGAENYMALLDLFPTKDCIYRNIKINTGFINPDKDIFNAIIATYGNSDYLKLKTNYDIIYEKVETKDDYHDMYSVDFLYNSYSLIINDCEYKHNYFDNSNDNPINLIKPNCNYIDIGIQKYEGTKFYKKNIEDNDVLYIHTSIGVLESEKITLTNGYGVVRLFLNDYKGVFNITLKYNNNNNYIVNDYKFSV